MSTRLYACEERDTKRSLPKAAGNIAYNCGVTDPYEHSSPINSSEHLFLDHPAIVLQIAWNMDLSEA
ncbi:MAG: hypothetical protein ACNYNY_01240 [Candidatus Oxydemutatoraceae bacterium WSBS_2016_MAG_OTU14]